MLVAQATAVGLILVTATSSFCLASSNMCLFMAEARCRGFSFRLKAINCLRQVSATIELREDQLETILGILEVRKERGKRRGRRRGGEGGRGEEGGMSGGRGERRMKGDGRGGGLTAVSLPCTLLSLSSFPSPLPSFHLSRNLHVRFVRHSTAFSPLVASRHVMDSTPPSTRYWTISRSTQTTVSPYGST